MQWSLLFTGLVNSSLPSDDKSQKYARFSWQIQDFSQVSKFAMFEKGVKFKQWKKNW